MKKFPVAISCYGNSNILYWIISLAFVKKLFYNNGLPSKVADLRIASATATEDEDKGA